MSCVPEVFVATCGNGHRRGYVKYQGNSAAVKHASHIAQLLGHGEAEDGARIIRIGGGRLMRD